MSAEANDEACKNYGDHSDTLTGEPSIFGPAKSLSIGWVNNAPIVTIYYYTGQIELGHGVTNEEAAKRFWEEVAKISPVLSRTIASIEAEGVARSAADILRTASLQLTLIENYERIARARRLLETVATPLKK